MKIKIYKTKEQKDQRGIKEQSFLGFEKQDFVQEDLLGLIEIKHLYKSVEFYKSL